MNEARTPAVAPTVRRLIAMALFLVFCSLYLLGQTKDRAEKSGKQIEVSDEFYQLAPILCEAFMAIRDKYVEPVSAKELIEGAINGMFAKLDPHSQWMPADDFQQLEKETEGEFSGIGIHIILDSNRVLTCASPIPGSPAAKAGLLPWDRIIEIEGKSTENITLMEAVKKLTGPAGTKVSITVYREGVPDRLHFTIERAQIKIASVYSTEYKDDAIGYARIAKFSKETSEDLRRALEEFNRHGMKGVIIDVRFNTGGLLKEALDVSSLFLPKGKVIVRTRQRGGQETAYRSERDPVCNQPLVVLINRVSASASEIFAGAIKDHRRGYLIAPKGERTFGKGSVQTIEELAHSLDRDENGNPRRSAMRITTAKFYTPNGSRIEGSKDDPKQPGGIAPDLEVPLPKGYEREMFTHLLGEVDITTEPVKPSVPKSGDAKTTGGATSEFYLKKPSEPEKQYVDLQLEDAKKYLRLLIMEHSREKK
ncbi:MAG: S41 family peptidase [Candidatus Sumerlaeia bacterium]|nr:S41 family peptidase [Candidatus Sumerlaeia bacterium]